MAMRAGRVLMPLFSVAVMILAVYGFYGYFVYHQLRETLSVEEEVGEVTTWALLVAGSKGYYNYRHQADVCHAYQVLKQGGLDDKNIVVFMFDDIASSVLNQRRGKLINHPDGEDVYAGVPRDYTGASVSTENLFAALLGDEKSIRGGSGKVIKSRSTDQIFFFFCSHGDPGHIWMPNNDQKISSTDLMDALEKKHALNSYKSMVIYLDSCYSASMFAHIFIKDLNIYVVTSTDVVETSHAEYCLWTASGFDVCIGNLFGVSWLEDSEMHNLRERSLEEQFNEVKERVSKNGTYKRGSHVRDFGNKDIKTEKVCMYQGFNPKTVNHLTLSGNVTFS